MVFLSDLAGDRLHVALAVGTVEEGWVDLVGDMLAAFDAIAASARHAVVIDVFHMGERDGTLACDVAVEAGDPATAQAVGDAVAAAVAEAGRTCSRCGAAGRLRLDRPAWPSTRCDGHAGPRRAP